VSREIVPRNRPVTALLLTLSAVLAAFYVALAPAPQSAPEGKPASIRTLNLCAPPASDEALPGLKRCRP
jgi:hypothetical protein